MLGDVDPSTCRPGRLCSSRETKSNRDSTGHQSTRRSPNVLGHQGQNEDPHEGLFGLRLFRPLLRTFQPVDFSVLDDTPLLGQKVERGDSGVGSTRMVLYP